MTRGREATLTLSAVCAYWMRGSIAPLSYSQPSALASRSLRCTTCSVRLATGHNCNSLIPSRVYLTGGANKRC
jgi:hypothetical protein